MRLGHAALWCADLESMRTFYETYFNGRSGPKYVNPAKGFESYFIRFDGDAALEIMRKSANEPQHRFSAGAISPLP